MWPFRGLLSLTDVYLRFIPVCSGLVAPFALALKNTPIMWMDHSLRVHSPAEGRLGGFQVPVIITNEHPSVGFCVDVSVPLLWANCWVVC